jgi:hypothetical protein
MNTLTETNDLVHRHSVVSEKFSNFLRTSAGNSVRYEAVNAMLLNEFLKEHRKVQKLEAALDAITARLNKQESELKKVVARVEVGKAAREIASKD